MISWRAGRVVSIGRRWPGAVELTVVVESAPAGTSGATAGETLRGLAYPTLVGEPVEGDRVLLNVSAQVRGLGTGGYALVVALPDRLPPDPAPGPGHLVKARYTPLQAMVLGVDEQESDQHAALAEADSLGGMPVVVADLHSALPAVVAGARWAAARDGRPAPRVAYVMTDGGALPAWFSRTVADLRAAGWLATTVTVGQAFGGDLEAVTVHTGLLAARHVADADLAVVAQGPGNLGTGTRWGFSGVAAGEAVNAAGTLGGRAIASLRVSAADPRERHQGVSHHSLTAYGRVALHPADVVVPVSDDPARAQFLARVAADAGSLCPPHRRVDIDTPSGLRDALAAAPVRLSTMGRGLDDDPEAFLAAAAAGVHAVTAV
ncbi:DUF3866 family protein [Actinotalea sp. M2MS4P-6]|uniref:DUF3866 family protein n=1 Tax=Actinotalea sp. M2MS4P-6 TaxID=2983762 RepID=UPI0021E47FA4|nr:DUF3866 family protein [Actinotalea sp. M2MS4P-6]MCV2394610.1 DUF3866 family protein [Actinotalea sp. M2MS4P-6]